jgi:SAM-dependent methyltransferase
MSTDAYTHKAEDYAAYRPPYAPEAVDALLTFTGVKPDWRVADIGSGTGNVARHLVGRARQVFAVEPNAAMRQKAEELLNSNASFRSIAGTAEHTTLPRRSVDLITVGQALHWFEPEATIREFARILKPGGWLAAVWNRFCDVDRVDVSRFFAATALYRLSVPMTVRESWLEFIGGARSAAGTPGPGSAGYDEFVNAQRSIFDARSVNGITTVEYWTELMIGRLHGAPMPH